MAHTLHALAGSSRSAPRPEPSASDLDSDAVAQTRIELAACFQAAARHGFDEGICNHFSALLPGRDDLFLVNPYGYAFSEITAERLLICDLDGHVLAGQGQPEATAFFIHARLHRARPALRAAFHTHMPHATALSMLEGAPLLWAGQTALKFYGRIAVDEDYNGLALDAAEGDRIAAALGTADVLFLKNHGVMVTGPDIAQAWDDLYYLERAAQVQLKAMASGRALKPVAPDVAQRTCEQMRAGDAQSARAHLDSLLRTLRGPSQPLAQ
ncbi:aldolase [Verminephrobacter eiseniae]|uniref:aldolase n=1 Tax=Verminephrobacter eiseniae TaxID=364317 RepID=UPI0010D31039|nr:aldolase [Verminephrobacter eiseniae]KAB7591456.1 aldolase [Verminephrobacter sp. Larva24]MCW5229880.1 aldolase [Verminephrobacter eiseniae]MCW5291612.1 aldolase [Verminephrobacter eiseniae]MCW8184709.1 aldolase [Verminephrobacter eiseniae]MCW8223548.1 aldolase [Verminephrobacter eiseniae]